MKAVHPEHTDFLTLLAAHQVAAGTLSANARGYEYGSKRVRERARAADRECTPAFTMKRAAPLRRQRGARASGTSAFAFTMKRAIQSENQRPLDKNTVRYSLAPVPYMGGGGQMSVAVPSALFTFFYI
jgi:hypothetical protein